MLCPNQTSNKKNCYLRTRTANIVFLPSNWIFISNHIEASADENNENCQTDGQVKIWSVIGRFVIILSSSSDYNDFQTSRLNTFEAT